MGRQSPRAFSAKALPPIAVVVVVACGRLGFDLEPQLEAGLGTSHPRDAGDSSNFNDSAVSNDSADSQGFDAPDGLSDAEPSDVERLDAPPPADVQVGCTPACTNAHGTTSCVDGTCFPICAAGYADCDGDVVNGCEANIDGDPIHCGRCQNTCIVDSGSPVCKSGVCGSSSCAAGTGDCDGNSANGCETDLNTSTDNCRFCGNACTNSNGTTSCRAGDCNPVCGAGFGDCDNNPTNGCESSLATTSNCGMCGNACTSDAGTPVCNGNMCMTSCDLSGPWAAKLTIPLTWPATSALASGSGALQLWAMLNGTQSGNAIPATLTPCGLTISDDMSTVAAGSELYGITFPNSLFDQMPPYLPIVSTTVTLGASMPGSTFSVPAVAFLFGLTMTNPTTDPWPSTPETVTQFDADQDTKPGVTALYKSGGSYIAAAVNSAKSVRADKAYLAVRIVGSFTGSVTTCANLSGPATIADFNAHVLGCEHVGGGDCTQTESDFVDSNVPGYVTGSATIALVKVASSATCATVRGAL